MKYALSFFRFGFYAFGVALLVAAPVPGADPPANTPAAPIFEKPIRLKAGDTFIDSGEAWGHSGPCIADVDGDGKLDLVVGDFSGKFRFYKNIGTNQAPRYAPAKYLMAGGVEAQVPIY